MYQYTINTDDPSYQHEQPYLSEQEMQEMRQSIVAKYHRHATRNPFGDYVMQTASAAHANVPLYQECFLPEPLFPYTYRITCFAVPMHCENCLSHCYEWCESENIQRH